MLRTYNRSKTTEQLFWDKVDKKSIHECWEWLGSMDGHGYGNFWDGEHITHASRYMYKITRRHEIPKGLLILHKCNNSRCVNPYHIYAGTQKDNMRDMRNSNRINLQGISGAKFYEGEVWLMKRLRNAGFKLGFIAKVFKCDPSTISVRTRDKQHYFKEV